MVRALVTPSLLLPLSIAARLTAAGTIPSTIETSSRVDPTSVTSFPTLPPIAFSSQVPVTHEVAQQQPQTGHNYALDPFGFLGSTDDDGNADDNTQQEKQTLTSKATETTSRAASASASKTDSDSNDVSSTSTSNTGSESRKSSSTDSATDTSTTQEFSTQSVSLVSATTDIPAPSATPSQATDGTGSDSSSASSMNSWKIIGIGVLAVAGVVTLVLGTAFQDTILRAVRRPFRRRGDSEEVLVPDWRRGSWCFEESETGTEKFDFGEEGGPRLVEGEKGNLAIPLPPVSPFPLRRTPSANSRLHAETCLVGIGTGNAGATNVQDNSCSILPSPPPAMHTPQSSRGNGNAATNTFERPGEQRNTVAYGGME